MAKVIAFLKSIGAAVKWAGKQLWSLVADRQWDFDPYKVGGFACIGAALVMGFRVFEAATAGKAGTDLAVLAGLVGTIAGLGTFLFSQARKSDDTLKTVPVVLMSAPEKATGGIVSPGKTPDLIDLGKAQE